MNGHPDADDAIAEHHDAQAAAARRRRSETYDDHGTRCAWCCGLLSADDAECPHLLCRRRCTDCGALLWEDEDIEEERCGMCAGERSGAELGIEEHERELRELYNATRGV